MNFITRLFKSNYSPSEQILNTGLSLAMQLGKQWRRPINDRLKKKYSYLSDAEAEEYDINCRKAMDAANQFIHDKLVTLDEAEKTIEESELKAVFTEYAKTIAPWINAHNITKLYRLSCYYAWRDGLNKVIK